MPLKKYQKKFDYAYTYGVYPTLDLFKHRKHEAIRVVFNTKGQSNQGYREVERQCKQLGIRREYDTKAIQAISAKQNTYIIGVFKKYTSSLNENANHVLLDSPSNTGNMGTIIRAMLGFGFKDLAIIKPAVDVFDPKVIRSSMGSFFGINFEYFDGFRTYLDVYGKHNLYPFVLDGKNNINDVKFKQPYTLIFGNESSGLAEDFKDIGESVYIPHTKNVDSLNLSIATGIALFKASNSGKISD